MFTNIYSVSFLHLCHLLFHITFKLNNCVTYYFISLLNLTISCLFLLLPKTCLSVSQTVNNFVFFEFNPHICVLLNINEVFIQGIINGGLYSIYKIFSLCPCLLHYPLMVQLLCKSVVRVVKHTNCDVNFVFVFYVNFVTPPFNNVSL